MHISVSFQLGIGSNINSVTLIELHLILDEFGIGWIFDPDDKEQPHTHDLRVVKWRVTKWRIFSRLVLFQSARLRLDGKLFLKKYDICSRRLDCNCHLLAHVQLERVNASHVPDGNPYVR